MIKPCFYACLARKMYFCSLRRNLFRLMLLIVFGTVMHNECLVYYISSFSWPEMKCGDIKKLHSVLLVADPQILGEKSEPWFARWDNDRYLKQSFGAAFRYVQPEMVFFLGDLMDEGSLATDKEYQRYFHRFKDIFQLDHIPSNKTVFIPGDNDIGGEDELVTEKKVKRFNKFFFSPTVFSLGTIQVIKVDKMQRIVPSVQIDINSTRLVISHMPLLGIPSAYAMEVLQKLRPHLILSAHDHKSMHFSADIDTGERTLVEALLTNNLADKPAPTWRFQKPDHIVNEVVVPTCSYRMGVTDMGFGVALLDEQGEACCYQVLWLPSRFRLLYSYLAVLVVLVVLLVILQCSLSLTRLRPSPQFRRV